MADLTLEQLMAPQGRWDIRTNNDGRWIASPVYRQHPTIMGFGDTILEAVQAALADMKREA